MIVQKLAEYYDRLQQVPEEDVAAFGFSYQKISFVVVLNPDGSLQEFHDARIEDGNRSVPRLLVVPGQSKPSGAGINPGFLWDNAQYMLGFKVEDSKPERTRRAFEAFRDRHLAIEADVNDEALSAACRFLEQWNPPDAATYPVLAEITAAFGVFRIAGAQEFVHERARIEEYWLAQLSAADDAPTAPSLVSGEVQPIARLHEPKIKGVRGGQSSGATLVSFNDDAYESYGKSQSFNAPVGVADAFKYCTALNRLTANRERQVHLGDTTVVFWSETPTQFEADLPVVFENVIAEDEATLDRLQDFFNSLRRAASGAKVNESDVSFFVLGLSPNAARISVRFWLVGTVQEFAVRLGHHLADLRLAGAPPNAPPITLQRIIDQTARERDDIQPLLSGAVLRSVLTGSKYPQALAAAILRRIRADRRTGGVDGYIRAAVLKACLVRNERLSNQQETIAMTLDTDSPHMSYHLGRLFAALEKTQKDALGADLNVTIKDRYLSSASANPSTVFPRLLRLHAHHLDKLGVEQRKYKNFRDRLVQEICGHITAKDGFPHYLPSEDQGRFFVGYYHQMQSFFTKKSDSDLQVTTETEE